MSSILQVWRWPIALGLLTASGLVTALVSDAWGDAWSWLALGVPLAVVVWHALRRPAARRRPKPSTPSRERR